MTLRNSAVVLVGLSLAASGCFLLDQSTVDYHDGSAHLEFTWTEGSPAPGAAVIPSDYTFRDGFFTEDSPGRTGLGATVRYVAEDGTLLQIERFTEKPDTGGFGVGVGTSPIHWSAVGEVGFGCTRDLTSTSFREGVQGTITCPDIQVNGGSGDLMIEFSARP